MHADPSQSHRDGAQFAEPARPTRPEGFWRRQVEFRNATSDEYPDWQRLCFSTEPLRLVNSEYAEARSAAPGYRTPQPVPAPAGPKPKLRERKTWHVTAKGYGTPETVDVFWRQYGDRPDRLCPNSNMVVTAIDCQGDDLRMAVTYTVKGGHPADFRRWIGRFVAGRPLRTDELDATCVEKVAV